MRTITIQPDETSSADTWLASNNATTNYVNDANLEVGESNTATANRRSLIKFDLSAIPVSAHIISATLYLYVTDTTYSSNDRIHRVFRQKRAWVENQATWNIYSTGNNWGASGGFGATDCEQTDIGSQTVLKTLSADAEVAFSLTASAIKGLINGEMTNNGFLIKADTESNDLIRYRSASYATASKRPKLVVTYNLSGGCSTII